MQIVAAVVLILTGIVLILSLVRLFQREITRGKRPDTGMWMIFLIMVLMAGAAVFAGAYLLMTE